MTVTVHALFHGRPLCGYGEGKPPGEWPPGQAWLAVTEIGRVVDETGHSQWCQACLQKATEGGLPAAAAGTNVLDHMRVACSKCGEHPAASDPGLSNGICVFCGYIGIPPGSEREAVRAKRAAQQQRHDGMKRFEVWSVRSIGKHGADVLVGRAIQNRDGSISVELPDLGVRLKLAAI